MTNLEFSMIACELASVYGALEGAAIAIEYDRGELAERRAAFLNKLAAKLRELADRISTAARPQE